MQDLWVLLRELRLRGVKQINDLVIDRSIFGQVGTDPGADGAPDRAYNASPDALMVGFGAVRLMFLPDAAAHKWVPLIDPPLPGLKIEGKVEWTEARCPGAPVVSTEPLITQQGVTLRVSGKVAGSCGEFSLYRLALSQPDYATEVFRMLWRELGGTFKARSVPAWCRATPWCWPRTTRPRWPRSSARSTSAATTSWRARCC